MYVMRYFTLSAHSYRGVSNAPPETSGKKSPSDFTEDEARKSLHAKEVMTIYDIWDSLICCKFLEILRCQNANPVVIGYTGHNKPPLLSSLRKQV